MRIAPAALVAAALLVPAGASAQYPPPKDPGKVQPKPKGPHHTYTVCKKKHRCDFRTIQKAVNRAKAGDTIRVANGTYREAVLINGKKKRYLRLIGNPKHPRKVALRAKGNMQNAIFVNNADKVSVNGFYARGYKSNGFFFTNVNGYDMNHLVARQTGVYGLYAFNTIGGTMRNSEAFYVNDGAFYIGQTPPQDKPKQTIVKNVSGWGSPLGFSATNMRYVTITKSRFYNNGAGIVPNALDSEKYPPPEKNVIIDNDIFWNNLNFHVGHPPFRVDEDSTGSMVPIGTGILLLGGRENRVENNRIFGNYLGGVAAIDGILLQKNPQAKTLDRNIVKGNQFGRGGTDTNGHDIVYDGSGSDNCFTLAPTDTVLDKAAVSTCSGKNPFSQSTQNEMLGWIGANATKGWRAPGHPPKQGYKPLEMFP
jgi:Right handed beta helix region